MKVQFDIDLLRIKFPDYIIIKPIGSGGQKCVFLSTSDRFGEVVIKIVDPNSNLRIDREIEAVKRGIIHVPKILEIQEIETQTGKYKCIIEEYIKGITLSKYLEQKTTLDKEEILSLAHDLLETAADSEEKKVVHRDIKPQNIIFGVDGHAYILDFGIARILDFESITSSNNLTGPCTMGYAPIEQVLNKKDLIDGRTDLFSIGITLYECTFGKNPFLEGKNNNEIFSNVVNMPLPVIEIKWDNNNDLLNFILSLSQKYPRQRPPTCKYAFEWIKEINSKLL